MPNPSDLERQGEPAPPPCPRCEGRGQATPAAGEGASVPCHGCGRRFFPPGLYDLSAYDGPKVACITCRAAHAEAALAAARAENERLRESLRRIEQQSNDPCIVRDARAALAAPPGRDAGEGA